MQNDIAQVLIDRHAIAKRVEALAADITRDLRNDLAESDQHHDTIEITLVPILAGSFMFVADLIRHLPLRMQIRMLAVTSYPGTATASRGARVEKQLTNLPDSLAGCHVLLIDDILDSGGTLQLALELLKQRDPASLKTCVLLKKNRPDSPDIHVDYLAFEIPDEFIVGYGLDFDDYYRNLPDIVTLKPDVFESAGP